MIKFFRKTRQELMKTGKTGRYLKYAIGEIVLVVVGILIALSINNWNEKRKKNEQEKFILEKLQVDLASDISAISSQIEAISINKYELLFCIDALLGKTEPAREELVKNLSSILTIIVFNQNRTTISNIISTGKIEYIQNQTLTDSITAYYSYDYKSWDTALRDYTRNITAPFFLKFDHIPQASVEELGFEDFTKVDISQSKIKPKTLEDYRNELFILNTLRQKIWNMEGQEMDYLKLKKSMTQLQKQIDTELNDR
jgi:uncharacterized protein DUF6090